MKKKIGLFLTSVVGALSLTSCAIEFSTSEYSGGISYPSSEEQVVEYYPGDNFDISTCTSFEIDFSNDATSESSVLSTDEQINDLVKSGSEHIESFEDYHYISKGVGGMKLGYSNANVNGEITINTKTNFDKVKIYAYPRHSEVFDHYTGQYNFNIDDSALSVNDSKYIKLNSQYEASADVKKTECSYLLSESVNYLTIASFGGAAIITKIIFYSTI